MTYCKQHDVFYIYVCITSIRARKHYTQCSTWPLKVGYADLPCRRLFNIWHCAQIMAHVRHLNNMNCFIQPRLLTTLGLYGKHHLPYSEHGGRKTKIILTFSLFFSHMRISSLRQRRYACSHPCPINYISVPGHLFIHLGGGVPLNLAQHLGFFSVLRI